MLKLTNITKKYYVADMTVEALKGINLCFRKNEFVSILGPSGCGKTTLLNIIGGLDKYTKGDLVINGRSTKEFKDRDWDVYRNHRIGFIFQSYNLIPHQTVLGNVELALTIAGISKAERIERAKKALDRVGLANQYKKKPNQLSGGQCQRVAIARALVNEPEILLADEPTGALDTETSVQIMDLIKEISKEKLVIMVTHNPDLAFKYSNRIVNLLDGEVKDDSNPFTEEAEAMEIAQIKSEELENQSVAEPKKSEKAKMSFFTSFMLSARNLWSKFKRTLLVGFAGSIGIIGVSSVLAVSTGVHDYINGMQDDMLSGNPITITKESYDLEALTSASSLSTIKSALEAGDYVKVKSIISYLVNNQNALKALVYNNEITEDYVNYIMSMPEEYYNSIALDYGIDLTTSIYTDFVCGEETSAHNASLKQNYNKTMSISAINQVYATAISKLHMDENGDGEYEQYSQAITSLATPISQCVPNNDYILSQYDLVYGNMPQKSTDCIIVIDEDDSLSDLVLAQLGYYYQDDFYNLVYDSFGYQNSGVKESVSYEDILARKFTWYPNDDIYNITSEFSGIYYAITGGISGKTQVTYNHIANASWTDGIELNIVGIVKPKEGISYGCLSAGLLYQEDFAREIIDINKDSKIVYELNTIIDFFANYEANAKIIVQAMGVSPTDALYDDTLKDVSDKMKEINEKIDYVANVSASYQLQYFWEDIQDDVYKYGEDIATCYAGKGSAISAIASAYGLSMGGSSNATLDIRALGGDYLPESISIYPINFDQKDLVTDYLDAWNNIEGDDSVDLTFNTYDNNYENITGTKTIKAIDRLEIKYTDSVGLIISLINTMIDIITIALVCFTALSLVVSCVMIAIITYVSVMERVKEIGVIRALGGRKKDVSHLFNAETFIIGLGAGILGTGITYILQVFGNAVVKIASNGTISAISNLKPSTALIMILVSIALTLISGLIPSKSAAKKDPVVALRTE